MAKLNPPIPSGYSPIGPGQLAAIVTFLEMTARPPVRSRSGFPKPYELVRFDPSDLAGYRALFRKIGEKWMWISRLLLSDETLRAILTDPRVEIFVLRDGNEAVGLVELDFREAGECELAFFGLAAEAIGKGLGRALMEAATALAWAKPIKRWWVHTCTFDHPSAAAFYIRSGFRAYAYQVEVDADPRLTGHFPRDAAPQIPLIEG